MLPAHMLVHVRRVVRVVLALGALEATVTSTLVTQVLHHRAVMRERLSARVRAAVVPHDLVRPVSNCPLFVKASRGSDAWKRRETVWSNSEATD